MHTPVHVWVDGSCSRNPGPMGAGIILKVGEDRKFIEKFTRTYCITLGEGTNNLAEILAIECSLTKIKHPENVSLTIYTDSKLAIGWCVGITKQGTPWKVNAEHLVAPVTRVREKLSSFAAVKFVNVKGHSNCPENNECDSLAVQAAATPAT